MVWMHLLTYTTTTTRIRLRAIDLNIFLLCHSTIIGGIRFLFVIVAHVYFASLHQKNSYFYYITIVLIVSMVQYHTVVQ